MDKYRLKVVMSNDETYIYIVESRTLGLLMEFAIKRIKEEFPNLQESDIKKIYIYNLEFNENN